ncbi:MAG: hypothetical protein CME72_09130 [Halomonadaceae bacterium]|nr:hypothetical protein [Halomonadaceae bacterium]
MLKMMLKNIVRKAIRKYFDLADFIGGEIVGEREKRILNKYRELFPESGRDDEMIEKMRAGYMTSVKNAGSLLLAAASLSVAVLTLIVTWLGS